jgi:hypothetical protein
MVLWDFILFLVLKRLLLSQLQVCQHLVIPYYYCWNIATHQGSQLSRQYLLSMTIIT